MEPSRAPVLFIVNGHPATGKTTFARRLSESLGVPLYSKDDFKELLHRTYGAEDREASRKLGLAAYSLLQHSARILLESGQSLIIESNFDAEGSGPWIKELEEQHSPIIVQVFLHAQSDVIARRFSDRSEHRHAAHFDDVTVEELRKRLLEPYEPLDTRGVTLEFDTTDFGRFDIDEAAEQVMALLPGKS